MKPSIVEDALDLSAADSSERTVSISTESLDETHDEQHGDELKCAEHNDAPPNAEPKKPSICIVVVLFGLYVAIFVLIFAFASKGGGAMPFGAPDGMGGLPFDAGYNSKGVSHVVIRAGDYVDGIQLHYRDGTASALFGGTGGTRYVFFVEEDDAIVSATVWSGWGTDALQFHTCGNITSPKFGGTGGDLSYQQAGNCSTIDCELVGMYGRSGDLLDQIKFVWMPVS